MAVDGWYARLFRLQAGPYTADLVEEALVTALQLPVTRVTAMAGDLTPSGSVPEPSAERVPAGMLVVAGDNKRDSFDSQQIGFIPSDRILGVAIRHFTSRSDSSGERRQPRPPPNYRP